MPKHAEGPHALLKAGTISRTPDVGVAGNSPVRWRHVSFGIAASWWPVEVPVRAWLGMLTAAFIVADTAPGLLLSFFVRVLP